jgi:sulfite reductase (NADPH) flavoprotein alpha-component
VLFRSLDQSRLLWASGYFAGLAAACEQTSTAIATAKAPAAERQTLTVLYGSQTGNAKRWAGQLAERAGAQGLDVRLVRASDYSVKELAKEQFLYVVISTHSAGDEAQPPDDSRDFVEQLLGRRAPKVPGLSFAVLALGDTSYPDFCGVGRKIDERLEALGGTRLFALGEADVDIDTVADPWLEQALQKARERQEDAAPHPASSGVVTPLRPNQKIWNRQRPFHAQVLASQRIVADDSIKDVRHIELSLEESGITYQPGDALGVWPTQSADLVRAVLATLSLDGDTSVTVNAESKPLSEWLTHHRELTTITRPFLAAHAERAGSAELRQLLEPDNRARLAELLASVQVLDLLRSHPAAWTAQELVENLRPLAPRMYSIASSQKAVDEEVHLTVDHVHYRAGEEDRWGVASHYLFNLEEGDTAPVFIDGNDRFRLPEDDTRDIIMIGPGTGVAPFRAFVQERAAAGATGRNWLFFGNPHRRSDFLYQIEWQKAVERGELHRLDVAFSRDQDNKIYVQHRIREQAADLWAWLQGGAHVYLCGDAEHMAPDVHAALIDVAVEQGGKSPDEAQAWISRMMTEGRYARDVY